jgi:hypothetical protein
VIPWERNELAGVTDFRAQIGPTGGARGFEAMTGTYASNAKSFLKLFLSFTLGALSKETAK